MTAKKPTKKRAPKKPPIGRPSKCNPDRIKIIADALAEGHSIANASIGAGISERTYHLWITRGITEQERIDAVEGDEKPLGTEAIYLQFVQDTARALACFEAEIVGDLRRVARGYELVTHDKDGREVYSTAIDWRAGAWLLERKFPDRYGNRQRLEHTGAEGGPIRSEQSGPDVSRLSLEKRRQLLELLAEAEAAE